MMNTKVKRSIEKHNWELIKPFVDLPPNINSSEYRRKYMRATRQVAGYSSNPKFNAELEKHCVGFVQFLLEYDIVLHPRVKNFLNRDIKSFIKEKG